MSELTLIKQSVSEARRVFTATVKAMAASGDEELVVLVRKRGKPVAGILSARELGRFYSWRAEQARAQNDSGDESAVSRESREETAAEQEKDCEVPHSAEGTQPDNLPPPENYARRWLSQGNTPEMVLEWLVLLYGESGLTRETATQIVESIARERRSGFGRLQHVVRENALADRKGVPSVQARARKRSQSHPVKLPPPDSIQTPEHYARHFLCAGYSQREVLRGLKQNYGESGLTPHVAERIVKVTGRELGVN